MIIIAEDRVRTCVSTKLLTPEASPFDHSGTPAQMLPPGFEPGLSAREAEVMDRTTLQELCYNTLKKPPISFYICWCPFLF